MRGYGRAVNRVLLVVLGLNLVVATAKVIMGWRAGSLALLSDGTHSGVDALNNVVAIALVYMAAQPADEDHPYGHSKHETLGAFVVSGLLFVTAFEVARAAVGRFLSPTTPDVDALTVGVVAASLLVSLLVSTYERARGRRLGSEMLVADSSHTRSDVWVSLAVLGGFAAARLGYPQADPVIAFAIAGVIAWAGWSIFQRAAPALTDRAIYDPEDVDRLVRAVPGVASVHDIRSRGTDREAFVQMHLVVDTPHVEEAHDITDAVEAKLESELGAKEVFVHVEPEDDDSGPPGTRADSPSTPHRLNGG